MNRFEKMPPVEFDIPESKIQVRLFEANDADDLARLATDPAVTRYVPWAKWVTDTESAQRRIQEFQQSWQDKVRARYVIEQDGEFVGYVGMWPDRKEGYFEFGFAMLPESRGKGLGTKIVGTLINRVASDIDALGMVAHVDDSNEASKATVTKLGFSPLDEFDNGDRRYELELAHQTDVS